MKWTKKKLFTVRFKGRKPRALLWRKTVYREWYEYAKLYQSRGGDIPHEFGDLLSFTSFEEWWRHPVYGFELFCEPYMDDIVSVLKEAPDQIEPDHILIDLNINSDQDKLIQLVTREIKKAQKKNTEYQSRARYQPSKPMKYCRAEKFAAARRTFLLTEQLSSHEAVVKRLRLIPSNIQKGTDTYDEFMLTALRKVSRHKRAVLDTFKNLEKGTFP